MSHEDLTKILLDKMETVLIRTNDLADNLNKTLGKLESKELQCSQHSASVSRAHTRIDNNEIQISELKKDFAEITGAKMVIAWLVTTGIAIFALLKH